MRFLEVMWLAITQCSFIRTNKNRETIELTHAITMYDRVPPLFAVLFRLDV
jgi:hypothetical protein